MVTGHLRAALASQAGSALSVTAVPWLSLLALRVIADDRAPPFLALSNIAGAARPKTLRPEASTIEKPAPAGFSFRPGLICSS